MTKAQFRAKYRELSRKTARMIRVYGEAALKSGAFELKSADDNYSLPKNVLTAACEECAWQWAPLTPTTASRRNRGTIKNVRRMTYPDFSRC